MGKIISKTDEHRKGNLSLESIQDFCFFLYLIATSAHQTGEGFDAIFIRVTFVLFFGFSILHMITTRYFKWNSFIAWFLLFLGYGYLSCLWAKSIPDALYYNNTFIQMVGCIICITNRIKTFDDIDKYLRNIVYSILYTSLILYIKTPSDEWGSERIGYALGMHPNDIGLRFAIGVLIALYFAISKKKYYNYLFVALFTVIAMFSGSRKGILMCVMVLVLFPLFSYGKIKNGKDLLKFIIQVLLIIAGVGIVFYLVMNVEMFYNVIGRRLEFMLEVFNGDTTADGSVNERSFFIRKAIELFKAHPVLGYGLNNFKTYMAEINYSHQAYSHNNYTELLSTLGIVGFSIYYSMILSMVINSARIFLKENKDRARNTMLILVLVIICFLSYWCVSYQSEYFIIIYALVYMNIKLHKKESEICEE